MRSSADFGSASSGRSPQLSGDGTNTTLFSGGGFYRRHELAPDSAHSNPEGNRAAILFHGMTGTPGEMEEVAGFLFEQGYDVYVPRLSGHGTSIEELRKTPAFKWIHDAEETMERACAAREYKSVLVAGLSFGSFLAAYLALEYDDRVDGVIMLAPPMVFRSRSTELVLSFLSYFPDRFLNVLGVSEKAQRPANTFRKPRESYTVHSVAALARMFRLKRYLGRRLSRLGCPVLLVQDPGDHLLAERSVEKAARQIPRATVRFIPGGEHELPLGHKIEELLAAVKDFLPGGVRRERV